jgi:signal peptide peptidase SppA
MWVTRPTEELWTGTEDNLRAAQELADRINALDLQAFMDDGEGEAEPSILEREGAVGVIKVHGQLFASVPTFIKRIFNIADYTDIGNALVEAAKDPSIGSILLDVDSPGGAVNGVDHVAGLVKRIDREVKPVQAVASGMMASAAYWISSGARQITAGPLSSVGSIGVIQIHREESKADEQMGYTTTVMRAGKYKALGNPYEPLSDAARAEIQMKLDYTYGMFMSHVADARGLNYDVADARMGQGRVFIGQMARDAGLVDKVGTYGEALTGAQELAGKSVDTRKSLIQNAKNQKEGSAMKGKKATLTDADVAMLANGVPVDQLAGVPAAETAAPAAEASPAADAAPAPEAAPVTEAAAEAPAAAPAVDQSAVVALLEKQLKDAQASELAARVELSKAADRMTEMAANLAPLEAIARDTVKKLFVALGGSGDHVASLDTKTLLKEHETVSESFTKRFKVGGVAAASAHAKGDVSEGVKLTPVAQARIKAARIASK